MDRQTADELTRMTSGFYAAVSASFSATRQAPWDGWRRVAELAGLGSDARPEPGERLQVLDLACGNLRFERFLADTMVQAHDARQLVTYAADNCDALALTAPSETACAREPRPDALVHYWHRDLARDLCAGATVWQAAGAPDLTLDAVGRPVGAHGAGWHVTAADDSGAAMPTAARDRTGDARARGTHDRRLSATAASLASPLPPEPVDLAVSFGFLHHLPLPEQRATLLRALVDACAPGGVVAVSFWQPSHSPKLLAKAQRTTASACAERRLQGLGPRDYLLGWQGRSDVLRYVHDFSEAEIDELAAAVADHAVELARFSADGATGDLNRYLVLRRTDSAQAEAHAREESAVSVCPTAV